MFVSEEVHHSTNLHGIINNTVGQKGEQQRRLDVQLHCPSINCPSVLLVPLYPYPTINSRLRPAITTPVTLLSHYNQ